MPRACARALPWYSTIALHSAGAAARPGRAGRRARVNKSCLL